MDEKESQQVNGLSINSDQDGGGPASETAEELSPVALASTALHRPATAIAISLVILPVLYRIGFIGSLVILVLAVSLNAVPETRQLFDAFLGKTPTGRSRLALVESLESRSGSPDDSLVQHGSILDDDSFIDLQVGDQLHPPLSKLIDLVQRDFISYWYDSSVALSTNTPFPKYTKSMLNCIINNLVERVKRQDPKEVSIYLFHSLSNAIITQLRQDDDAISPEQLRSDKDVLIRKVRRTSEELMLTLGPRSSTSSPMVLALLTEVISLQIWSTIQSLNSDYINTAIVDNFGEAITLAKEAQKEAKMAENTESKIENIPAPSAYAGPPPAVPTKQNNGAQNGSLESVAEASAAGEEVRPPPLEKTIRFDDDNHTIAMAGMPGFVPNLDLVQPRSSSESARKANIASPTTSQPGSPRSIQKKRLEDQTLEEALENGAARFRAFGKNLVSAGHKFLDAALPLDDTLGAPLSPTTTSGQRLKSLPPSKSSTVPSRKGKERELDPIEPMRSPLSPTSSITSGSPTSSLRGMSVDAGTSRASSSSAAYAGSSSRPSSMVGRSSAMSRSSSAHSSLFSGTGPQGQYQPPQTLLSPAARIQRILDSLEGGTPEQHEKLVKQIEISLFSKDLSLLFPEDPPDEQLRAVLMRHTASDESVDPSLIELSDAFHEYLEKDGDDGKTGELVLRMWTLLDHFGYMVDITHPDEGQIKGDGLQLLKKIIAQARDLEAAFQKDSIDQENTEALEKSYWTAVEMAILRLEQNPNREIFDPLKDWLLRFIQASYWDRFLRANLALAGASGVTVSAAPPRLTRVPSASTSKRPLSYAGAAPQASLLPPQDDTYDLGDAMHADEPEETSMPLSHQASSHAGQAANLSRNASQDLPGATSASAAPSAAAMTSPAPSTNGDLPSVPSFSISITDLSPPTAYQNNHVKNRKDLEFLIAVEVEGSPGYILARKYLEFEKMDHGIKKALPQSGTKAFPRAPLPSTNFQTSENLCKSLESYLEALLREPRYANCDPVARFFAKERTDSKTGVVNPLVFLGQGVNNLGKGVTEVGKGIGRSGEMATRSFATGFNQLTNTITAIPGLKRTSSGHMEGGPATPTKSGTSAGTGSPIMRRSSADSLSAPAPSASRQSLTSPSTTSLATSISSVKEEEEETQREDEPAVMKEDANAPIAAEPLNDEPTTDAITSPIVRGPPPLPPRPDSPGGYEIPDVPAAIASPDSQMATKALPEAPAPAASPVQAAPPVQDTQPVQPVQPVVELVEPEVPAGLHYQPRKKVVVHHEDKPSSTHTPDVNDAEDASAAAVQQDIDGRMSFDELLEKDRELQMKMAEKEAAKEQTLSEPASVPIEKTPSGQEKKSTAAVPKTATTTQANLSAVEFSSVLSFAMAILEEAYELSDGAWNLRRGILRVLETVLRTSYAGVIRGGMAKLVQSVSEEEFYVKQIDKLRESFWPPPDNVWWSSVEGYTPATERTAAEKEATRLEARRLLQLQAPEGLKVALGPTATTVALGRLHDSLQGPGAEAIVSSMMLDYLRLLLL